MDFACVAYCALTRGSNSDRLSDFYGEPIFSTGKCDRKTIIGTGMSWRVKKESARNKGKGPPSGGSSGWFPSYARSYLVCSSNIRLSGTAVNWQKWQSRRTGLALHTRGNPPSRNRINLRGIRCMFTVTTNQNGASALPLSNAIFCLDCEVISNGRSEECPACKSRSVVSLARMLGGSLLTHRSLQEHEGVLFDVMMT